MAATAPTTLSPVIVKFYSCSPLSFLCFSYTILFFFFYSIYLIVRHRHCCALVGWSSIHLVILCASNKASFNLVISSFSSVCVVHRENISSFTLREIHFPLNSFFVFRFCVVIRSVPLNCISLDSAPRSIRMTMPSIIFAIYQ